MWLVHYKMWPEDSQSFVRTATAFSFCVAVVAHLHVQRAAANLSEDGHNPETPATYPAILLPSQWLNPNGGGDTMVQCSSITSTNMGRHALAQMDNDIHERLSDAASTLSRQRGKCALGSCRENPVFSCAEMRAIDGASDSGLYWVRVPNGSVIQVYCDFAQRCNCSSNDSSNASGNDTWTRVAFYNMSDSTHRCPYNLWLKTLQGIKLCYKKFDGCTSIFFSTFGFKYDRVCGRVIGYQFGEPDAFKPFYKEPGRSIDDLYVDGISLTHGQAPRQHVWTFAIAKDARKSGASSCPCINYNSRFTGTIPPFVDDDYFCDTGSQTSANFQAYLQNPIWDGEGCTSGSSCCEWQRPPWFCKKLATPSQSDLECRICSDSSTYNEHLLIQLIEVYIQ